MNTESQKIVFPDLLDGKPVTTIKNAIHLFKEMNIVPSDVPRHPNPMINGRSMGDRMSEMHVASIANLHGLDGPTVARWRNLIIYEIER